MKINKKKYYKVSFTITSPLAIGSGENEFTDKDILKDKDGIPFIPGSAIAGVCREAYSKSGAKNRVDNYFGFVEISKGIERSSDKENSKLLFYDAKIVRDDEEKIHITHRDSVALDEYKTAKEGAKFDMEILEPGIRFVTYYEQNFTDNAYKNVGDYIAELWLGENLYLGAKTMRGYGAIKDVNIRTIEFNLKDVCEVEKWLKFDMYKNECWEGADTYVAKEEVIIASLKLNLKLNGGISIRKYTTDITPNPKTFSPDYEQLKLHSLNSDDEVIPVIPGTSWAGAFRHRMTSLCKEIDEVKYFGKVDKDNSSKGKIRFSESQLTGGKSMIISRNSIDRFSGGTANAALFTERTYYGGDTALTISFETNLDENMKKVLAATIADLANGFLAVGGLTSVGRGCFLVEKVNDRVVDMDNVYETVLDELSKMEVVMNWVEFIKETKDMKDGYIIASLTDEYIVNYWDENKFNILDGKEHKLLEARVFNKYMEHKLFRTDISKKFKYRMLDDSDERDTFTSEQFLDVDTAAKSANGCGGKYVKSTSGGRYFLPLENVKDAKVVIKYYVDKYEESGQARVGDWRVVEFEEGE